MAKWWDHYAHQLRPHDQIIRYPDVIFFLLAVVALLYSQQKDRDSVRHERATEARAILSNAAVKLNRWVELSEAVFDGAQIELVQTSEIWGKDGNADGARDYLWRQISRLFTEFHQKVEDERISGAYIGLYRINEALTISYEGSFDNLRAVEKANEQSMLLDTQRVILSFRNVPSDRVTAQMGNQLRELVGRDHDKFVQQVANIVNPLQQRILDHIKQSDETLLARKAE